MSLKPFGTPARIHRPSQNQANQGGTKANDHFLSLVALRARVQEAYRREHKEWVEVGDWTHRGEEGHEPDG